MLASHSCFCSFFASHPYIQSNICKMFYSLLYLLVCIGEWHYPRSATHSSTEAAAWPQCAWPQCALPQCAWPQCAWPQCAWPQCGWACAWACGGEGGWAMASAGAPQESIRWQFSRAEELHFSPCVRVSQAKPMPYFLLLLFFCSC